MNPNTLRSFINNPNYDPELGRLITSYYENTEEVELLDTSINIIIEDTPIYNYHTPAEITQIMTNLRTEFKNIWLQLPHVYRLDTSLGVFEWVDEIRDLDPDQLFRDQIYIETEDEVVSINIAFNAYMSYEDMDMFDDIFSGAIFRGLRPYPEELIGFNNLDPQFHGGTRQSFFFYRPT
jgi:hypothetical protein